MARESPPTDDLGKIRGFFSNFSTNQDAERIVKEESTARRETPAIKAGRR